MRSRFILWSMMLGLSMLTACSSYAPPADLSGMSKDQLVAKMGAPEMERQLEGGRTRLEYPRGPFAFDTWFIELDAAGNAIRSEQVKTEEHFNQITPGMSQDDARKRLGKPSDIRVLARSRGVVWGYRYDSAFCQWFEIEIAADQIVRSVGYGEPPECDRNEQMWKGQNSSLGEMLSWGSV